MRDDDASSRNAILQKALTRYIAHLEPSLDFEAASVALVSAKAKGVRDGSDSSDSSDESEDDDDDGGGGDGSVARQLARMRLSVHPPQSEWVALRAGGGGGGGGPRVEFKQERTTKRPKGGGGGAGADAGQPGAGRTSVSIVHSLRCRAPDAEAPPDEGGAGCSVPQDDGVWLDRAVPRLRPAGRQCQPRVPAAPLRACGGLFGLASGRLRAARVRGRGVGSSA